MRKALQSQSTSIQHVCPILLIPNIGHICVGKIQMISNYSSD